MDSLVSQAAKIRYMSVAVNLPSSTAFRPITVDVAAIIRICPPHFLHIPGFKVGSPATPTTPKGL